MPSIPMSLDRVWSPRHDSQKVDLVFMIDCTGSMGAYINQAQGRIKHIADSVSRTAFNVRLALVKYRDHPPQDTSFVVQFHDFTSSVDEMKSWVDDMSAGGGGDCPEAVADGLHAALNLSYRQEATKICIWIGDAPPHGLNMQGDEIPGGCPNGHDPIKICREMAAKGIILYCLGCEPAIQLYRDFFMGISHITGGQYIRLQRARNLSQVIISLTNEEVQNENLMGYVDDHIRLELRGNANLTVEELATSLHEALRLTNSRTRRMRYGNSREIEPLTEMARRVSFTRTLPEVRDLMQHSFEAPVHSDDADQTVHETSDPQASSVPAYDITDLDEVTPMQCERVVRRSLARSGFQPRYARDSAMDFS